MRTTERSRAAVAPGDRGGARVAPARSVEARVPGRLRGTASAIARCMHKGTLTRSARALALLAVIVVLPSRAGAHCDTLEGPVVSDARAALDRGDANLVLHWVRPEDESAIRTAFRHTLAVRRLGSEARELADDYFFETLVRLHRAGEGAPYTGLKTGAPEPIIAATDHALEHGSPAELETLLVAEVRAGLARRFEAARVARRFKAGDVAAGRAFVAAYVPLTHWVEAVFEVASGGHPAAGSVGGSPPHTH